MRLQFRIQLGSQPWSSASVRFAIQSLQKHILDCQQLLNLVALQVADEVPRHILWQLLVLLLQLLDVVLAEHPHPRSIRLQQIGHRFGLAHSHQPNRFFGTVCSLALTCYACLDCVDPIGDRCSLHLKYKYNFGCE